MCLTLCSLLLQIYFQIIRKTLKLAKSHLTEENAIKRHKLNLQEREFHLCEFQAGLITKEEYQSLSKEHEEGDEPADAPSSDWDYQKLDEDME